MRLRNAKNEFRLDDTSFGYQGLFIIPYYLSSYFLYNFYLVTFRESKRLRFVFLHIYVFIAWIFLSVLCNYLFILEREKGERHQCEREKHSLVTSRMHPGWRPNPQPDMCPDQELSQRPFDLQGDAQPTRPHQSGLVGWFLHVPWPGIKPATLANLDDTLNQLSYPARALSYFRYGEFWERTKWWAKVIFSLPPQNKTATKMHAFLEIIC